MFLAPVLLVLWPFLVLLLVLLFYKRDITPAWNPVIRPPQAQAPQVAPTSQSTPGFSGTFTPPPPIDLNDVFRRPRR